MTPKVDSVSPRQMTSFERRDGNRVGIKMLERRAKTIEVLRIRQDQ